MREHSLWSRRRVAPSRRPWAGRFLTWAVWGVIAATIMVLIVGWVLLWTWALQLAWNFVAPPVFGWPELTFWQAFALSFVLNLLGSGFRASVHVRSPR